jgi:PKD repeat protein
VAFATFFWAFLFEGINSEAYAAAELTASSATTSVTITTTHIFTQSSIYTLTVVGTDQPINHLVQIKNTAHEATRVRLAPIDKDFSSIARVLDNILTPEMLPSEKAMAIYNFGLRMRYHWWPATVGYDLHDPIKLFNVYGYGFCDDISVALAALFDTAGLPSRIWHLGAGEHTVVEAYYDGSWHLFDADRDGLYLLRDNITIAGVTDLIDDLSLIERAGPAHTDLIGIYAKTGKLQYYPGHLGYTSGHEIELYLAPQDSFTYYWQPVAGYHDDTGWNSPPPPRYANGELVKRLDPTLTGFSEHLLSSQNLRFAIDDSLWPPLSTATITSPGYLEVEVTTPYPFVRNTLSMDYLRLQSESQIALMVSRSASIASFLTYDLLHERYKISDLFVQQHNINSFANDGLWPALHSNRRFEPAYLDFKIRKRDNQRLIVGGMFYRAGLADSVALSISLDGILWQKVWVASPAQIGYFSAQTDISTIAPVDKPLFLRYEFTPVSYPTATGVSSIRMAGLSPFNYETIWTSDLRDQLGSDTLLLDLTPFVALPAQPANYGFSLKIVLSSLMEPNTIGISRLTLTNTVQVAPLALPGIWNGDTTYAIEIVDSVQPAIVVTHTWSEVDGASPPSPPDIAESPRMDFPVDSRQPILFSWSPSQDSDGDAIAAYQVEVCSRSDCLWPISPALIHIISNGTTQWRFPFHDWLNDGGRYYWRVRAMDATGRWGEFSKIWSFTVAEAPIEMLQIESAKVFVQDSSALFNARINSGSNPTYQWDFGDGAVGVGVSVTHTYTASGEYTVTLAAINPVSVMTTTARILVGTPPQGLTVLAPPFVAIGESTPMTAAVAAGSEVTYAWAFSDGTLASGALIDRAFATPGIFSATVAAANLVGVITKTVVVRVMARPASLVIASPSFIALGESARLTASVETGDDVTYMWKFSDGIMTSGAVVDHSFFTSGVNSVTVTATNPLGVVIATVFVLIVAPPTDLTIVAPSFAMVGESVRLTATVLTDIDVTYTWEFSDGIVANGPTTERSFLAPGVYSATVTVVNPVNQRLSASIHLFVTENDSSSRIWLPLIAND